MDKDFLSALVGLIHNIDLDEGSASNSVGGGQFRTLKSIFISGFNEVPVELITNCSFTIKNMKILHLSFVGTPDAKTDASTLAPAKPSAHFSLASPPKFVLEKFHFSGIPNGNVDSLATTLIRELLAFSQLKELDIYPQGTEDLAFVYRVIQSAAQSLQVFKL